eukprot:6188-Heterococcus_DN1.PRE.3
MTSTAAAITAVMTEPIAPAHECCVAALCQHSLHARRIKAPTALMPAVQIAAKVQVQRGATFSARLERRFSQQFAIARLLCSKQQECFYHVRLMHCKA